MISKRITVPLLCLLPLLAVMALMGALHTPTTNAAPDGTQTVTTLADSGAGSLRQAIADATAGDSIEFSVNGIIVLATELTIDKNLTINGGDVITVSGGNVTRVFNVANGNVTFNSLTIANGNDQYGGGMLIQHGSVAVTITDSSLVSNTALYEGGGVYNSDNIMSDNSTLIINDSIISGNMARSGGGIFSDGHNPMQIHNSTISNNLANSYGGGVYIGGEGAATIGNSIFSNNFSYANGGGIYIGFGALGYGTVTINDSIISSNSSVGDGCGIYNYRITTISNSTISDNFITGYYGNGGGIYNDNNGSITINNSTISGNSADDGGGVYTWYHMVVNNSTISGNSAKHGGGFYIALPGGSGGPYTPVKISSSTVTANRATTVGGGINSSNPQSSSPITITNSIVSNNIISSTGEANDLYLIGSDSNFASGGHNLIGVIGVKINAFVDGVDGDQVGVNDPKLNLLANNGGSTLTHAIQSDSPALDTGADCDATDQRGIARPQGAACDIGAYEYEVVIIYTNFVFLPVVMK